MSLLDRFRKKGWVMGSISIRDLPVHDSLIAVLAFTRVSSKDSAFPSDDPGAPFHKCDYAVPIKAVDDLGAQPFTFNVREPVGFYYLVLRVTLGRRIRGKIGAQIENFPLSTGPVELRHGATLTVNGSVT